MAPNQARTMTRPYRATRGAMPAVRDFPGPSVNIVVASFCVMRSPFCMCRFPPLAAAELALPSLAPRLVETVIQAVYGRGSDQRPLSLRKGGAVLIRARESPG